VDHLTPEQQSAAVTLLDKNKKPLICKFLSADTLVPNFSFVMDRHLSPVSVGAESRMDKARGPHVLMTPTAPVARELFEKLALCEWPESAWQVWSDPTFPPEAGPETAGVAPAPRLSDTPESFLRMMYTGPDGHDANLPDCDDWELNYVIQGLEVFALNPEKPTNLRFMARLMQYEIANSCLEHCCARPDFLQWAPLAIEGLEHVAHHNPCFPNWALEALWTFKEAYALERSECVYSEKHY
jgi:hypothetical protein